MPLTDRPEATGEVCHRAAFLGDRSQVGEEGHCLIVACEIEALDLSLDLAPNTVAPPSSIKARYSALRAAQSLKFMPTAWNSWDYAIKSSAVRTPPASLTAT